MDTRPPADWQTGRGVGPGLAAGQLHHRRRAGGGWRAYGDL